MRQGEDRNTGVTKVLHAPLEKKNGKPVKTFLTKYIPEVDGKKYHHS
jgi:hypothetical protein